MSNQDALYALPQFKGLQQDTLLKALGMEVIEATKERVVARMAVTPTVHQPYGLLHGGASVALAETVASIGAMLNVSDPNQGAVGIEINANHLRAVRDGHVTATARPIHVGRSTQVWGIEIVDDKGRAVCISRCTLAVVPRS
jgi:1,4-dihydroxy-2-naphthoyl-CoA hydrolase